MIFTMAFVRYILFLCFCSMLEVRSQAINNTYPTSSINLIKFGNLPNEYYFSDDTASYFEASNFCLMYGMDLVKLDDITENNALLAHISTLPATYYYTGAHKLGRDQWLWIDGEPLSFTAWGTTDPNSPTTYHCFVLQKDYGWNDCLCHAGFNFICETR